MVGVVDAIHVVVVVAVVVDMEVMVYGRNLFYFNSFQSVFINN